MITIAGNRVQVWDSNTGKQLVVLKGHDAQITHAAFSPDGQRVVTTSFDHTTRLWDVVSGQESTVIEGHTDKVYHAAFSPDGQRLVTTSQDNTARLWNLTPGRQEIVLKPHTNQMMDSYYAYATFSPDGQTVTTVSSTDWEGKDAEVRSWDVKTGKERMLISRQIPARYAKFSHDGTLLITTATNVVRIWDTKTTKQITILKQEYKYPYSDHIILSPDSQRLITISGNIANVWDIHTGKLLTALEGHKGGINDAVFSPDGQYISDSVRGER